MNAPIVEGKELGQLVRELSTLVEEVRTRAQRARTERAYLRYLGMLVPVYGTLLKAVLATGGRGEDQAELQQALRSLMHELGEKSMETPPAGTMQAGASPQPRS